MTNYADLRQAIIKPWIDNAEFGIETAYPNVDIGDFTTPWAELTILTNQAESMEIGALLQDEITGFLQVDLRYPSGKGDLAALQKTDEILSVYRRGLNVPINDICVRFTNTGKAEPSFNEQGWYRVVLTIEFRTRFNNR